MLNEIRHKGFSYTKAFNPNGTFRCPPKNRVSIKGVQFSGPMKNVDQFTTQTSQEYVYLTQPRSLIARCILLSPSKT